MVKMMRKVTTIESIGYVQKIDIERREQVQEDIEGIVVVVVVEGTAREKGMGNVTEAENCTGVEEDPETEMNSGLEKLTKTETRTGVWEGTDMDTEEKGMDTEKVIGVEEEGSKMMVEVVVVVGKEIGHKTTSTSFPPGVFRGKSLARWECPRFGVSRQPTRLRIRMKKKKRRRS